MASSTAKTMRQMTKPGTLYLIREGVETMTEWCEKNHEKVVGKRAFAQQMEARGIGEERIGHKLETQACPRGQHLLTSLKNRTST